MTVVSATPPTPYLRRLPNAFRTGPSNSNVGPGVNLLDTPSLSAVYASAHTQGATLIDFVSPTPAEQNLPQWSLLGVSFKASLYWISGGVFFGRMGGIFGGLLLPQDSFATTATGTGYPFSVGVMSLPDPTFRTNLWTPDTDDAPPTYLFSSGVPTANTPQSGYLQIAGSLLLPQPVKITTGENIAIGLWMLPSIIGAASGTFSFGMIVAYASYVLTYMA